MNGQCNLNWAVRFAHVLIGCEHLQSLKCVQAFTNRGQVLIYTFRARLINDLARKEKYNKQAWTSKSFHVFLCVYHWCITFIHSLRIYFLCAVPCYCMSIISAVGVRPNAQKISHAYKHILPQGSVSIHQKLFGR